MGMARHIIVADTEDEAMKAGKPAYEKWFKSFMLLWNRYGTKPPNVALPEDFTDFVRGGFAFVGTPDAVRGACSARSRRPASITCSAASPSAIFPMRCRGARSISSRAR